MSAALAMEISEEELEEFADEILSEIGNNEEDGYFTIDEIHELIEAHAGMKDSGIATTSQSDRFYRTTKQIDESGEGIEVLGNALGIIRTIIEAVDQDPPEMLFNKGGNIFMIQPGIEEGHKYKSRYKQIALSGTAHERFIWHGVKHGKRDGLIMTGMAKKLAGYENQEIEVEVNLKKFARDMIMVSGDGTVTLHDRLTEVLGTATIEQFCELARHFKGIMHQRDLQRQAKVKAKDYGEDWGNW
jgi:hypothetical protein